eukprot:5412249-Prymnesium_polylepis.1
MQGCEYCRLWLGAGGVEHVRCGESVQCGGSRGAQSGGGRTPDYVRAPVQLHSAAGAGGGR